MAEPNKIFGHHKYCPILNPVLNQLYQETQSTLIIPINLRENVDIEMPLIINKQNHLFITDPQILHSLKIDNAGGDSNVSEAYSMELFRQLFGGKSFICECEVQYDYYGASMVDYVCTLSTRCSSESELQYDYHDASIAKHVCTRVGVSVTRAMGYPTPNFFTSDTARNLLCKKLHGLIVARNAVSQKHSFYYTWLHIWCQNTYIANIIIKLIPHIITDLDIQDYIGIILTITDDNQIYHNVYDHTHGISYTNIILNFHES